MRARWLIAPTREEYASYNQTDRILLTFDDYADKETTRKLLTILKTEEVKAIFFLQGNWAEKNQDCVEDILAAGHWVGNHTHTHKRLTALLSIEVKEEISRGVKSTLLRPPYGAYNARIRDIAASLGYRIAFWTIDSDDWRGITASQIQKRVWRELHRSACVLLHMNGPNTLQALPGLIAGIRERGFELCREGNEIFGHPMSRD